MLDAALQGNKTILKKDPQELFKFGHLVAKQVIILLA